MQNNLITTKAMESVTASLKRHLASDIINYRKALKEACGGKVTKNYRYHASSKEKALEILADDLNYARRKMRYLESCDLLKIKEKKYPEINSDNDITYYYEDKNGDKRWNKFSEAKEKEKNIKGLIICLNEDFYKVLNPIFYWKDEMIQFIKTRDVSKLHHKFDYFRIGDEFYKKEEYFVCDNKAYPYKEYGIVDGKPVSLAAVLEVKCNTRNLSGFVSSCPCWEKTYYLEAMPQEEFEDVSERKWSEAFITIRSYGDIYLNSFLNATFLDTMFVSKGKRFYSKQYDGTISLTKEQCESLDIEPSEKHKEMYHKIETDFLKAQSLYCADSESIDPERMLRFRKKIMGDLRFKVELRSSVKGNGLLKQIIKELFPNNSWYYIPELKKRLAVLRELLSKEKEYAK